jgi:probable HAF family extracellular repeat protein
VRTPSAAYAINAAGQVTGYSTTASGTIHAFKYTAGAMTDLGTIAPYYTKGRGIDATGEVIAGSIETYGGGSVGVFVSWHGAMHNLLDLLGPAGAQWSDLAMARMNDSGAIIGSGTINGESHSFLATPSAVAPACNPADICGVGSTYAYGAVDIGPDQQLTIEDFLNFLSAFGDATGCSGTAPCNPADICGVGATYDNGVVDIGPDGDLTIEDFLNFLSAFGDSTGCP